MGLRFVNEKANKYHSQSGRLTCHKCRTYLTVFAFSPKQTYVIPQNMGWRMRMDRERDQWLCPRCVQVVDHEYSA